MSSHFHGFLYMTTEACMSIQVGTFLSWYWAKIPGFPIKILSIPACVTMISFSSSSQVSGRVSKRAKGLASHGFQSWCLLIGHLWFLVWLRRYSLPNSRAGVWVALRNGNTQMEWYLPRFIFENDSFMLEISKLCLQHTYTPCPSDQLLNTLLTSTINNSINNKEEKNSSQNHSLLRTDLSASHPAHVACAVLGCVLHRVYLYSKRVPWGQ